MTPDEVILAHHPLLFAIPAFLPAVIIAGVVAWLSIKDRRAEAAELAETGGVGAQGEVGDHGTDDDTQRSAPADHGVDHAPATRPVDGGR